MIKDRLYTNTQHKITGRQRPSQFSSPHSHTHTNNNLHSNATVEALNVNTEVTSK